MNSRNSSGRLILAVLTVLVAGGCQSAAAPEFDRTEKATFLEVRHTGDIKILTQSVVPAESMEALYQGIVFADSQGCIRLESEAYDVTVVWPKDFRAATISEGTAVLNAAGEVVVLLGESVALGGGEVEVLHEELGFTAADRTLAESRCPGRFWIVGQIPASGG